MVNHTVLCVEAKICVLHWFLILTIMLLIEQMTTFSNEFIHLSYFYLTLIFLNKIKIFALHHVWCMQIAWLRQYRVVRGCVVDNFKYKVNLIFYKIWNKSLFFFIYKSRGLGICLGVGFCSLLPKIKSYALKKGAAWPHYSLFISRV